MKMENDWSHTKAEPQQRLQCSEDQRGKEEKEHRRPPGDAQWKRKETQRDGGRGLRRDRWQPTGRSGRALSRPYVPPATK